MLDTRAGAWLNKYSRWLPRKRVPTYMMENDWIYVVDERWSTGDIPFQDVRGALHSVPLRLDASGTQLAMAQPPKGTVVIAGALRVVLGKLMFVPVEADPEPRLQLGGTVLSGACCAAWRASRTRTAALAAPARGTQPPCLPIHSRIALLHNRRLTTVATEIQALPIPPANSFGTNAAAGPVVAPGMGPPIPERRDAVPLGADPEEGFIEGAINYGIDSTYGIVLSSTPASVRIARTVGATASSQDPAYGGRENELILTDEEVEVPLHAVRAPILIVTRALVPWVKGFTDGRELFWFERGRAAGLERQFRPPPDAVLHRVLERWASAGTQTQCARTSAHCCQHACFNACSPASTSGDEALVAETQILLRARVVHHLNTLKVSGVVHEVNWNLCDPRHFLRLPGVAQRMRWREDVSGRDRRLILDVPLNTMAEIVEVLGNWNAAMAWRKPEPPRTAGGKRRERRDGDVEYFNLTDGGNDGPKALRALLSYHLEERMLTVRLPVARLRSTRTWCGGSQLPPSPEDHSWCLITGTYVPDTSAPAKDVVDSHLAIPYGA